MADRDSLGKALGLVPSGLFIVTVRSENDETGFLGSWVQQCGFDPPAVSVAVRKGRPAHDLLERGGSFCVNVVAQKQFSLMKHFGKGFAAGEPAFDGLEVRRGTTGAAILADSVGYLDCAVSGKIDASDHVVFVGHVQEGDLLQEGLEPEVRTRRKGKFGFDY